MAAVNINQLPLQLQNPVHFTHAHFFRLARLMAINKELYKRFRTKLPSLLDIRDYVSATKKILSEYKHTHEFYKAWMLLNLQFYKRIKEEKALTLLLQFNEHALNELLQLQRSQFFQPFPPPPFSIYYNPQATRRNHRGSG